MLFSTIPFCWYLFIQVFSYPKKSINSEYWWYAFLTYIEEVYLVFRNRLMDVQEKSHSDIAWQKNIWNLLSWWLQKIVAVILNTYNKPFVSYTLHHMEIIFKLIIHPREDFKNSNILRKRMWKSGSNGQTKIWALRANNGNLLYINFICECLIWIRGLRLWSAWKKCVYLSVKQSRHP